MSLIFFNMLKYHKMDWSLLISLKRTAIPMNCEYKMGKGKLIQSAISKQKDKGVDK